MKDAEENLTHIITRSHPQIVGDMSRVTLNFDLSKIPCTFTGSHLRAVTDADDDDDDAGHHSTTTRATYRQ